MHYLCEMMPHFPYFFRVKSYLSLFVYCSTEIPKVGWDGWSTRLFMLVGYMLPGNTSFLVLPCCFTRTICFIGLKNIKSWKCAIAFSMMVFDPSLLDQVFSSGVYFAIKQAPQYCQKGVHITIIRERQNSETMKIA